MKSAASVRTRTSMLIAAMVATLAVSCADEDRGPAITVGAGNSAQSELIAEIYAGALARTGARTAVRTGLGQRGDYLAALDADTVTLVGDDSGDLLTALDSGSPARVPDKGVADKVSPPARPAPSVAQALNGALPEGLAVSDLADGTDLRPSFALAHPDPAASLTELAPRCGELSVGIATGSELDPLRRGPDPQRDVLEPLRTVYHCDIAHHSVYGSDTELRNALRHGKVQAGVFTAPATLLPGGAQELTLVADPSYAFRAQNIVPLFRKGALTERQLEKLNYVAGELTTAELVDLVRRVRDEHASAAELARAWLDAHSL
ncbi:transporter [Nocardia sp. CDC159]|uniref:Transporter n=1 Tax=Nocardia pulmonis TaxID=2951408 RepID=A0A9X2E8Z1_9NOCA|nr:MULTISPECIES: glycine betaine ABC transporter substrate-binding protein [Nocardia]MCM6775820.1 transporter [Nocardia pulmonis]MCM6788204.1 transporter [Nocardia sp. CDC159]